MTTTEPVTTSQMTTSELVMPSQMTTSEPVTTSQMTTSELVMPSQMTTSELVTPSQMTTSEPVTTSQMTTSELVATSQMNTISTVVPTPLPRIEIVLAELDEMKAAESLGGLQKYSEGITAFIAEEGELSPSEGERIFTSLDSTVEQIASQRPMSGFNLSEQERNDFAVSGSKIISLIDDVALAVLQNIEPGEPVGSYDGDFFDMTLQRISNARPTASSVDHDFGNGSHGISLPESLFASLGNQSVKMASAYYTNLHILSPNSSLMLKFDGVVVSTTLQCNGSANSDSCTKATEQIDDGVIITFQKSASNGDARPKCAFWNLTSNDWSTEGCEQLQDNSTHIICRCSHLTHFGLLFAITRPPSNTTGSIETLLERLDETEAAESLDGFLKYSDDIRAFIAQEGELAVSASERIFTSLDSTVERIVSPMSALRELERDDLAVLGSKLISLIDDVAGAMELVKNKVPGEPPVIGRHVAVNFDIAVQRGDNLEASNVYHDFSNGSLGISLPESLFASLGNQSAAVKVASVFYSNLGEILIPSPSLMSKFDGVVLSTTVQCNGSANSDPCAKATEQFDEGVIITFQKSPASNGDARPECAFWNLTSNDWSTEGCEQLQDNSTHITCRCNHLTHFGLLFAITPPSNTFGRTYYLALNALSLIGYVVSFVFIVAMIVIFVGFRSLWNLRNYIHINLSVNLLIGQFIVLVGGDRNFPTVKSFQLCAATGVLSQYFFHVMFMWMLMEGVILYIKLVKVFGDESKKQYFIFTILSYGLPFVYLFLSVPLGFARREQWSYGMDSGLDYVNNTIYIETCFLTTSDYFIFTFIVPVLLIVAANCVIFVTVMVIITKKIRKSPDSKKHKKIRTWIRSAASLLVILGIGWLVGLFAFHEIMYLIAVLYYGFQGVFIFVLFVLLSSKVRKTVRKKFTAFVRSHTKLSDPLSSSTSSTRRESLFSFFTRSQGKYSYSSRSVGHGNKNGAEGHNNRHQGIELGTFEIANIHRSDSNSGDMGTLSLKHCNSEMDNDYCTTVTNESLPQGETILNSDNDSSSKSQNEAETVEIQFD